MNKEKTSHILIGQQLQPAIEKQQQLKIRPMKSMMAIKSMRPKQLLKISPLPLRAVNENKEATL